MENTTNYTLSSQEIEANKTRFLSLLREYVQRDGIEDLIAWIEGSDFFTAPASTRFHGNYEGGLCEHSLNVYDCMTALAAKYPEYACDASSIALCSLTHDLCKCRMYVRGTRNRKNAEGKWESYRTWEFNELFPGGHGEKSAFIVLQFIKLLPEEYLAIRWHMGEYDAAVKGGDRSSSVAYDKYKICAMLHLADLEASQMLEHTEPV